MVWRQRKVDNDDLISGLFYYKCIYGLPCNISPIIHKVGITLSVMLTLIPQLHTTHIQFILS